MYDRAMLSFGSGLAALLLTGGVIGLVTLIKHTARRMLRKTAKGATK